MGQTNLQQLRTANGLEIIVGLWLIISPFGLGVSLLNQPLWNSVAVGGLVVLFATLRMVMPPRYGGLSWVNFVLGLWLVVSPFLFGFAGIAAALWNHVIVGVAVMVLALWSHWVVRRTEGGGVTM